MWFINRRKMSIIGGAVVEPSSNLYYKWLGVLTLAVLYNVLVIILRCVYVQQLHVNYQSTWMTVIVYLDDFRLPL